MSKIIKLDYKSQQEILNAFSSIDKRLKVAVNTSIYSNIISDLEMVLRIFEENAKYSCDSCTQELQKEFKFCPICGTQKKE